MKRMGCPKACPTCGREYSRFVRPRTRWQTKALLLFAAGIFGTVPWGATVVVGWFKALEASAAFRRLMARVPVLWAVLGVVVIAPALLCGALAMRMPHIVRMHCPNCGWSDPFLLDDRAKQ